MKSDSTSRARAGIAGATASRRATHALAVLVVWATFAVAACSSDFTAPNPGSDASADGPGSSSSSSGSGSSSSSSGGSSSGGSSSSSSSSGSGGSVADSGARDADASVSDADATVSDADAAVPDATDEGTLDTGPEAEPPPACTPNDAGNLTFTATGTFADGGACCPFDQLKTVPGACGCGIPDTDTDGDGVADCIDGCPKDPARTQPGPCGCGVPNTTPLCLVHRYSFNGPAANDAGAPSDGGSDAGAAATIIDSVGGANGVAVNATLSGNGSISLVGGQYVALPAGIVSTIGNSATFEVWLTWTGGPAWQRIFDLGSSSNPDGTGPGTIGQTYIFVTPLNGLTSSLRGAFTLNGPGGEASLNNIAALPTAVQAHVALVVDGVARTMSLYENGALVQVSAPFTTLGTAAANDAAGLSGLNDVNNWLGRSQYAADPGFTGSITEFRIYSAARTAAQVMASFAATPDGLPAQ